MIAFTVVLFIQVIMRYVFNNSLSWSEELARYIFIWMVFIGISYGAKQMKHLKIDVFLSVFPKKVRPYLVIFADVVVLALSAVIVYSAWITVQNYIKIGVKSPALHAPYWFIYSSCLVGYALTFFRQIQTIVYRVKLMKNGGAEIETNEEEVPLG